MNAGEEQMVAVAKIGKPHGVRGEMRVWLFSADSDVLFDVEDVFVASGRRGPFTRHAVATARAAKKFLLLTLDGVRGREAADALKGKLLFVRRADLPALEDPDEFYHFELIDREVVTDAGERLGALEEIMGTGGGDVLVVRDRDRDTEYLIPFVRSYVEVDAAAHRVIITPPEGLLEATASRIGNES